MLKDQDDRQRKEGKMLGKRGYTFFATNGGAGGQRHRRPRLDSGFYCLKMRGEEVQKNDKYRMSKRNNGNHDT